MEKTGQARLAEQIRKMRLQEAEYVEKLKKEPKKRVLGSEALEAYLGDTYTYSHNGYTVTIKLDGTWQEYPESIAEHLEQKLGKIAKSKKPVNKTTKISG